MKIEYNLDFVFPPVIFVPKLPEHLVENIVKLLHLQLILLLKT